jgi:hypothetical protein
VKHRSTAQNSTENIHLEGTNPVRDIVILKGTDRTVNTGVVHQDVYGGVVVYGTSYHLIYLDLVGYIGRDDEHLSAKGFGLLGRLLQFAECTGCKSEFSP